VVDKTVSETMPAVQKTSVIVKKWKVPIVSTHAEFDVIMLPDGDRGIGDCDDWNTVSSWMRDYGLLSSPMKGKWVMLGETYKTLSACRKRLMEDTDLMAAVKKAVIEQAVRDVYAGKMGSIHWEPKKT